MRTSFHWAKTRGHAEHGWLESFHTFSFANYYHPERMNFGVLRVLNDDTIAPGTGFGQHPHENMEIISIPLEGELEHNDSMGNQGVIRTGEIQVMSAGTGIKHSEMNHSKIDPAKFLQIWLFPNIKNVEPRYDQIATEVDKHRNTWNQVLSPSKEDEGVWVHQNAWFYLSQFDAGKEISYSIKDRNNGVYIFVIEGSVEVEGQELSRRDGLGICEANLIEFKFTSATYLLLMDVPLRL